MYKVIIMYLLIYKFFKHTLYFILYLQVTMPFYVLFISIIYVTILYLIHEYSIPMRYSKNTRVFKKCKSFSFLNVKNKILCFYFFL